MNKRNSKTKITSKTFPNVQKGTLRVSKPIANTIPSNINTGSKKEAEKELFVIWLATPAWEKEPKTQKILAGQLGVSEATLSDWKKEKGFWDRFDGKIRSSNRQKTANLVGHFYNTMITSKAPFERSLELWLSYVHGWNKTVKFSDESPESKKLTPEDKKEMATALLRAGLANAKQVANLISQRAQEEENNQEYD
ncbi:hypothetical protein A3B01_02325 [Candidatus Nomurabacteria bacterium RIFCSPLOWO2_01_FULL_41_52b]|nr:MAG: hypothetical protein A3B01_02325 [Candidatus Nomurabacteria bacterium RIFCSPLOWO2_01_FULL_41_52b]